MGTTSAALLQPSDGLLDTGAFATGFLVKTLVLRGRLIAFPWNGRLDLARLEKAADRFAAVAFVGGEFVRPADLAGTANRVHHVVELRRFLRSAGRERDGEDEAVPVSNRVEF